MHDYGPDHEAMPGDVTVDALASGDGVAVAVLFHEHYEPEAGVRLLALPLHHDPYEEHVITLTCGEAEQLAAALLGEVAKGRQGAAGEGTVWADSTRGYRARD